MNSDETQIGSFESYQVPASTWAIFSGTGSGNSIKESSLSGYQTLVMNMAKPQMRAYFLNIKIRPLFPFCQLSFRSIYIQFRVQYIKRSIHSNTRRRLQ